MNTGGLTKLTGPALDIAEQDPIDVVLLSHHQHTDNLDPAGRAFLPSAERVLSTTRAAEALGGNVLGMEPWSEVELESPRGGTVKVTAVHAQHGPDGSDEIQGPVLGFLLSAKNTQEVYVSGDNASRDVVRTIVQKTGELAIAILNAGAVHDPQRGRGSATEVRPRLPDPFRRPRRRCSEDPRGQDADPPAFRGLGPLHPRSRRAQGSVLGQRDQRAPARPRARSTRRGLKASHSDRCEKRCGCAASAGTSQSGARGTRTPDLLGAIQALSQLSYSPRARRGAARGGCSLDQSRRGEAARAGTALQLPSDRL